MIQNMAGVFRGDGGREIMISRNFGILYFSYVGMYLHNNPKKFDDERFFRDSDRKFATFEIRWYTLLLI